MFWKLKNNIFSENLKKNIFWIFFLHNLKIKIYYIFWKLKINTFYEYKK